MDVEDYTQAQQVLQLYQQNPNQFTALIRALRDEAGKYARLANQNKPGLAQALPIAQQAAERARLAPIYAGFKQQELMFKERANFFMDLVTGKTALPSDAQTIAEQGQSAQTPTTTLEPALPNQLVIGALLLGAALFVGKHRHY